MEFRPRFLDSVGFGASLGAPYGFPLCLMFVLLFQTVLALGWRGREVAGLVPEAVSESLVWADPVHGPWQRVRAWRRLSG